MSEKVVHQLHMNQPVKLCQADREKALYTTREQAAGLTSLPSGLKSDGILISTFSTPAFFTFKKLCLAIVAALTLLHLKSQVVRRLQEGLCQNQSNKLQSRDFQPFVLST